MIWLARITALLITTTAIAVLLPAPPSGATQSFDWSTNDLVFGEETPINNPEPGCKTQYLVPIGGPRSSRKGAVCVYDHGSWRYGIYQEKTGPDYAPRWNNYFVVGLGVGNSMYKVMNMPSSFLVDLPNSQDIIHDYAVGMFTNNRQMRIMKDFPGQLVSNTDVDETTYLVNDEMWEPVLPDGDSNPVTTKASGISENGRWLALEDGNLGLILKDLVTGELRLFSDYRHRYGVGSDASMKFAVSDNGSYVAMFDYNTTPTIYTITGNCGLISNDYGALVSQYSHDSYNACPTDDGRLSEAMQTRFGMSAYRGVEAYAIEPSGGALYFLNCSWSEEDFQGSCNRLPLFASGYVPQKKLAYLALGDSYSSGEGDIGKKDDGSSYYLPGTDGNNQCHLSGRSYPFLLRDAWSMSADDMKSVACSGARVLPDYFGSSDYSGQYKQMDRWNEARRKETREQSLNNFSPGFIRQIEFVEKHQPEKVTFTGGGNDVGFADILEYCASSYRLFGFIPTIERCAYATNSQLRASLNRHIDDQYGYSKLFVERIQDVSPATKIYIVGYPQFVASPGQLCFKNSLILDREERRVIRESVTRLNNVLKKVARDTGVEYVDIEDSLDGGQICQGSQNMTGPVTVLASGSSLKANSNMYHPNATGHAKIADTIKGRFESGFDYVVTDIPQETTGQRIIRQIVLPAYLSAGDAYPAKLVTGIFNPNSLVKIDMFSLPTSLGTATTLPDGSLETSIGIPAHVGIGKHLVTLTGTDLEGESLQVQQFVYVTSGIEGDVDGDGISDEDDNCSFVTEWYVGDKNLCLDQDKLAYVPTSTREGGGDRENYQSGKKSALAENSSIEAKQTDGIEEKLSSDSQVDKTNTAGNGRRDRSLQIDWESSFVWTVAVIIVLGLIGAGSLIYVVKKQR